MAGAPDDGSKAVRDSLRNFDVWTVADAVALLDPSMTFDEVRTMIDLFDIPVRGVLRAGYAAGRPPRVYAVRDVLQCHAALIKTRAGFTP